MTDAEIKEMRDIIKILDDPNSTRYEVRAVTLQALMLARSTTDKNPWVEIVEGLTLRYTGSG